MVLSCPARFRPNSLCPSLVGCSPSSVRPRDMVLAILKLCRVTSILPSSRIQSRTEGILEASTDGCGSVKSRKGCCELNYHLRSCRKAMLLLTMTQRHLRDVRNKCKSRLIRSWSVVAKRLAETPHASSLAPLQ